MDPTDKARLEPNCQNCNRESTDRRDCAGKAKERDCDDVLAVSDDQEDTWNDQSRRERMAKAMYE